MVVVDVYVSDVVGVVGVIVLCCVVVLAFTLLVLIYMLALVARLLSTVFLLLLVLSQGLPLLCFLVVVFVIVLLVIVVFVIVVWLLAFMLVLALRLLWCVRAVMPVDCVAVVCACVGGCVTAAVYCGDYVDVVVYVVVAYINGTAVDVWLLVL